VSHFFEQGRQAIRQNRSHGVEAPVAGVFVAEIEIEVLQGHGFNSA
jgi:hypothetical protein